MPIRDSLAVWTTAALFLVAPPSRPLARAWGDNGHIAVAKVADLELSAVARQRISSLTGGRKIHDRNVCMFADAFRRTPAGEHTKSWHYVNIPLGASAYDPSRDCLGDSCVVAQITAQRATLEDGSRPDVDRSLALKLLVHLVGDVHQPLHCTARNDDRGGNLVSIRFLDGTGLTNLHEVWDTLLPGENLRELDPVEHAERLHSRITAALRHDWESVTEPAGWAMEGVALAGRVVYSGVPASRQTPIRLNGAYVERARSEVDLQLSKAGVRLAALLNRVFGR